MSTGTQGETPNDSTAETANPDEQTTDAGSTPESKNDDAATPKTPEELQAELESLQSQLSKVNRESADRRKELDAFKKTQKAAEDAEKTELQKAQDELQQAQNQLEQSQSVARRHTLLSAVRGAGQQLKLTLNEDALSDLYDAGHFKDVETGDDGKPQNVDVFLKGLIKAKPYVLQTPTAPAPDIGASRGGSGAGEILSDDDYHQRATRFGINLPVKKS